MKTLFSTAAIAVSMTIAPAMASPHMRITKCDNARTWKDCAVIALSGDITSEDGKEFLKRADEIKTARIDLSSAGGDTFSGFLIGELVHARGFSTYVPDNTRCASSCAHIWTAGISRSMGRNAWVGFHSPLSTKDPTHADGMTSAMLGMYLSHIGYTYSDVMRIIGHDPLSIHVTASDGHGNITHNDVRINAVDLGTKTEVTNK
jgi:hypothetical protein